MSQTLNVYTATNPVGNVTISGNILTIVGAWRDASYSIVVTDTNTIGNSITNTLYVTEKRSLVTVQNPISNVTLAGPPAIPAQIDLAHVFLDNSQTPVTYTIVSGSNPFGSATLSNSILKIQGAWNASNYTLNVTCTNTPGVSATTPIQVTEIASTVTDLKTLTQIYLTNQPLTIQLMDPASPYFSDNSGTTNTYKVKSNPKLNASITGSALTIDGAYRNTSYIVTITDTNAKGVSSDYDINVTEYSNQPIVKTQLGSVSLTNNLSGPYNLPNFFFDNSQTTNTYTLKTNPFGAARIDQNGNLYIQGAWRAQSYDITVTDTNGCGKSVDNTITVTEVKSTITTHTPASITLSNTSQSYALDQIFADNSQTTNTYSFAAGGNPYGNAKISNNTLTIQGAWRATQYSVIVNDVNGCSVSPTSASISINVSEMSDKITDIKSFPDYTLTNNLVSVDLAGASPYFKDMSGTTNTYTVTSPYGNAYMNGTTGTVMNIQGAWRNTSYQVVVTDTNDPGEHASYTINVTELYDWPTISAAQQLGSVTLANDLTTQYMIDMTQYFSDKSGSGDSYSYSSSNSKARIQQSGNTLIITPTYQGTTYFVGVKCTNGLGNSATNTLQVTEYASVMSVVNNYSTVTVSNTSPINLGMSSYFTDNSGTSVTYSLSTLGQPANSVVYISGASLMITGSYSGATYTAQVTARNEHGVAVTNTIYIYEVASTITVSTDAVTVQLNDLATHTIDVSSYFSDNSGTQNTYSVSCGSNNSALMSYPTLSINGSYRNASYTATITDTNAHGVSAQKTITIVEGAAPSGGSVVQPGQGTGTGDFSQGSGGSSGTTTINYYHYCASSYWTVPGVGIQNFFEEAVSQVSAQDAIDMYTSNLRNGVTIRNDGVSTITTNNIPVSPHSNVIPSYTYGHSSIETFTYEATDIGDVGSNVYTAQVTFIGTQDYIASQKLAFQTNFDKNNDGKGAGGDSLTFNNWV